MKTVFIFALSTILLAHAEISQENNLQAYDHIKQGLQILEKYREILEPQDCYTFEMQLQAALDLLNPSSTRACVPSFFNCAGGVACSNCARFMSLAGSFATLTASIVQGACFTVSQIAPSTFLISFLTPFSVPPVVLATSNSGADVQVSNITNTSFTVTTTSTYGQIISFIAQQAC